MPNRSIREGSFRPLQRSIAVNQVVCRAVVFEPGRGLAFKFGHDSLGQHLAQFDAPLVKRINVPDDALREDAVLVKRDEFAENFRREAISKDDIRGAVALKNAMGHQRVRRAFRPDFLGRSAKGQRLSLGKNIRQSRALWAFVIVSSVVKVFDETMHSVSAGSRSRVASTKSMPSTFDTKRNVRLRSL